MHKCAMSLLEFLPATGFKNHQRNKKKNWCEKHLSSRTFYESLLNRQLHESFYRKTVCIAHVLLLSRVSLCHFFYTFHRRSCSLIAFTFFFFCLRNKAMNLYEVSVYLAKIFQFSNSATVDDHWEKNRKNKDAFS